MKNTGTRAQVHKAQEQKSEDRGQSGRAQVHKSTSAAENRGLVARGSRLVSSSHQSPVTSHYRLSPIAYCLFFTIAYRLLPIACLYAAGIGGFYETEFVAQKESDFRWNLTTPKHYFQGKFWANPLYGTELYAQASARTNEIWNKREYFDFERGWVKYWFKMGESLILIKEERHWLDSPLLKNVAQHKAAHFNEALSARLNIFKLGPFYGSFIFTHNLPFENLREWYGNYFDEASRSFISKIGFSLNPRMSFIEKISLGGGYLLKNFEQKKFNIERNFISKHNIKNDIVFFDFKSVFENGAFTAEAAKSSKKGSVNSPSIYEDENAYAFELRDLNIGAFRFQSRFYSYGDGYRNEFSRNFGRLTRDGNDSEKEFGRRGYYFESSYLWPKKMITFTYKRGEYTTRFDYITNYQGVREDYIIYKMITPYSVTYNAVESWIDFKNGIKNRIAVEQSRNRGGEFPGFLFELSGDTEDIYSRIQFRLKDIGSSVGFGERRILSAEAKYNIMNDLQFYTRAAVVESLHKNKNWSSAFFQLRYFIGWDIEGYLEYGEGWHTDTLSYDTDITDYERDIAQKIRLVFKINF